MRLQELNKVLDNYDKLDESDLQTMREWDLPEPHESREINFSLIELMILIGTLNSIIDKHGIK